jgi:hypothetical protein
VPNNRHLKWTESYNEASPNLALDCTLSGLRSQTRQMSNDPFAALPAAQRHTANSAIKAVLGAAAIATVRPITGGVSGAFVFLIEASGRRFVLRTEGPASPLRNPHQYFFYAHRRGGGHSAATSLPRR